MADTCARCPRRLLQQRAWARASPAQRALWLAEGFNLHQARGLCRACYLRAYRADEVVHIRPGTGGRGKRRPGPLRPCSRCGVTTRGEICGDCREVERELAHVAMGGRDG